MLARTRLVTAVVAGMLALGCEPPDEPSTDPAGAGDPGGAGPAAGAADDAGGGVPDIGAESPGPAGPGLASISLSLEPRRLPRDASRLDLELVALAVFVDVDPTYRNADTPCDAGTPGGLLPLETTVSFTAGDRERRPLASLEATAGGALREAWLVLRQGLVHADDRVHKVHAGAMCVMPDGLQYALVRLRPRATALVDGAGIELVVQLDGREQILVERLDCRTSDADECRDVDDDDEPLRYVFATQFPVRVEER